MTKRFIWIKVSLTRWVSFWNDFLFFFILLKYLQDQYMGGYFIIR